ncbi:unnamed protein product [Rotaria socialis]|uniref:Uncharacterized protein n=1 Tax=Rotaria socialis TaxID=392032 RepID=A0A818YE55_9BILA|nr:unnamed protein product [Rotaria socialis]CAF4839131.1 unnamed protein product [Rotaria socialis]
MDIIYWKLYVDDTSVLLTPEVSEKDIYNRLSQCHRFIRELALNNGYLLAFVEAVIQRQLHLVYTPRVIKPALPETDTIVLRVPYYGKPSQIYTKRVTVAAAKLDPSKKMRVDQNFSAKDQILTELKSGAVYETTCPECNDKYIGKPVDT